MFLCKIAPTLSLLVSVFSVCYLCYTFVVCLLSLEWELHGGRGIWVSFVYCNFSSARTNAWHRAVPQNCLNFLREALSDTAPHHVSSMAPHSVFPLSSHSHT